MKNVFLVLIIFSLSSCYSNFKICKTYDFETGKELIKTPYYKDGIGTFNMTNKDRQPIRLRFTGIQGQQVDTILNFKYVRFHSLADHLVYINDIPLMAYGRHKHKIIF